MAKIQYNCNKLHSSFLTKDFTGIVCRKTKSKMINFSNHNANS